MNGINAISAINGINSVLGVNETGKAAETASSSGVSFKSVLDDLIERTNTTDSTDKAANLELLTGDLANMHDVIIAGEEADLALRLTMQIRNKALDAYTEIMRMTV